MLRSTIVAVAALALVACSGTDGSGVVEEAAPSLTAPPADGGGDAGTGKDSSSPSSSSSVDAAKPEPEPEPVPVPVPPPAATPACQAEWFFGGSYTGVCLADCSDFGLACLQMDQGNCSDDRTCVPCVRNGKPTGALGCPK